MFYLRKGHQTVRKHIVILRGALTYTRENENENDVHKRNGKDSQSINKENES